MGRFRQAVAGGALVVAIIVLLVLFHDTVEASAVRIAALPFGYDVSFRTFHVGLYRAAFSGIQVRDRAGEPVFDANRIDAGYSLQALLPGRGRRRFGLSFLDLERPQLTLIHHPDGTYNVPIPKLNGPSKQNAAPFDIRVRVRDGSIALVDRYTAAPQERRQRIEGIAADAVLSPKEHSFYRVTFDLNDGRTRHPVLGVATFDDAAGYESQHWTARQLPIGPLVDFALSSHAINLTAGDLYDADLRIFSLTGAGGALDGYLSGRARLAGGKIYVAGLQKPVRDAGGVLYLSGDAISAPQLSATLAGVPFEATGGIFGFDDPQIRLAASGEGDLAHLRLLTAATAQRPLAGDLRFRLRAEGRLQQPLIFADLQLPSLAYAGSIARDARAEVAALGSDLDILDARLRYGAATARARGTIALREGLPLRILGSASAPSGAIPYLAQAIPRTQLGATAVVTGEATHPAVAAILSGDGPREHVGALANVGPDGTGSVGPISIDERDGGSAYVRVALDRPHGEATALIALDRFRLPPAVGGAVAAHGVAVLRGAQPVFIGGDARIDGLHVGDVAIGNLSARFGGNLIELQGGSFAPLPVSGFRAVVALRDRGIDLPALSAKVAGGELVASGSLGDGGSILVGLRGANPAFARSLGVPFAGGNVNAIGRIEGSLAAPQATLQVALGDGRFARANIAGSTLIRIAGNQATIAHSTLLVAGTYGTLDGTVAGLRGPSPHYDLRARVRAADVATLADALQLHLPYPEGKLDADVRVRGAGSNPAIDGTIALPAGSINGLAFAGSTRISGNRGALVARDGRVIVGSSRLDFAATLGNAGSALSLRGDKLHLADFNDYFDAGDTLGGDGRLALDLRSGTAGFSSAGTIAVTGASIRRLPLGNAVANWTTHGGVVTAKADVRGGAGSFDLTADVRVPGTTIAATAHARDLQLATWLPAAGIFAPVGGTVDGEIRAQGSLAAPSLSANAELRNGNVAGIPIDRFNLSATASGGRGRIVAADLSAATLSASASGTFGFAPGAPLDLSLHASSADVDTIGRALFGKELALGGTFAADVHAGGTLRSPALSGSANLSGVTYRGLHIPEARADFTTSRTAFDVANGSIGLERGVIRFAAHAPLAGEGSLSAQLAASGVDLAQFAPLFPAGTKAGGTLDGSAQAAGTFDAPALSGALALRGGTFTSPQLRSPIENGTMQLAFSGKRADLRSARFDVGGGSIEARGSATVANLRSPLAGLAYDLTAQARSAGLNLPSYYVGKLDGTLDVRGSSGAPPTLAGDLAFSSARIPLTALFNPSASKGNAEPPALAFHQLQLTVGRDVRIQSANIDVGGSGKLVLNGTLASPQLNGRFLSSGGSLSFYRDFTIRRATVAFSPGEGIVPTVDAVADTHIPDPSTNVTLRVTGPADDLNLRLASNPPYDRTQILGMLTGATSLGAVAGVQTGGNGAGPSPLLGFSEGYLNQMFARTLFEPLQNSLGDAFGLRNVQVGYAIGGGFSATASKGLGKDLTALFGETYGYPSRETFALDARLNDDSSLRAVFYQTYGSNGLGSNIEPYILSQPGTNITLQATEPVAGENGFGLHYVRHFK